VRSREELINFFQQTIIKNNVCVATPTGYKLPFWNTRNLFVQSDDAYVWGIYSFTVGASVRL